MKFIDDFFMQYLDKLVYTFLRVYIILCCDLVMVTVVYFLSLLLRNLILYSPLNYSYVNV